MLVIDDFLATGQTLKALAKVVQQSGASILGFGSVIEKSFEDGRDRLVSVNVPIVSLAIIDQMDETGMQIR